MTFPSWWRSLRSLVTLTGRPPELKRQKRRHGTGPWQEAPWRYRPGLERLEDRTVLATITGSFGGGIVNAGANRLQIMFSEVVSGADQASHYELRRAGADGLLGNADDPLIALGASYGGTTATLTFAPLTEDVYRLTVRDAIIGGGQPLDGDANGSPGGDWVQDFVVQLSVAGPSLSNPQGYGTGDLFPSSVAVGDFNSDGQQDLAVTNFNNNKLGILLGNGTGGFGAAVVYPSGGNKARAVVVGDFNGDCRQDLAIANYNSANVGILLGNGEGGFAAAVSYSSGGSNPSALAVGDFNGDGRQDLAVANSNTSNNVRILLGNGTGGFALASFYNSSGGLAQAVAVGDFNGDGRQDLAVTTNSTNYNLGIFLGDGAASFAPATFYLSGGSSAQGVAVGDFNGDGRQDLAVANSGSTSNNVSILLGTGTGTFIAPTLYGTGGTKPFALTVGDFNGDGRQDLAVANNGNQSVGLLLGTGTGSLVLVRSWASGGTGPYAIALGDFNRDGKQDLAVANYNGNNVSILLGGSTSSLAAGISQDSGGTYPSSVVVGDFNGDGRRDLAVANYNTNNVGLLLGTGPGSFAAATSYSSGGGKPSAVAVGDFNGDGRPDLAIANRDSLSVGILLGTPAGTFAEAGPFDSGGEGPSSVAVGDFNSDGKQDLAVVNRVSNKVRILVGSGTGNFAEANAFDTGGLDPCFVLVGDFNGDGRQDLAIANYASNNVGILLRNGPGSFAPATSHGSGGNNPNGMLVGDFNGDGRQDLAVANYGSNSVALLLSNGPGSFAAATTFGSGGNNPSSVAGGDFNGDGQLDLAVTNAGSNNVGLLLGNGPGSFAAATTFDGGGLNPSSLAVGDYNGDGRLDLAVANYSSSKVGLLLGTTPAPILLSSPNSFPWDIKPTGWGAGQDLQGSANASDGLQRLLVNGSNFRPVPSSGDPILDDGGRTVVTPMQTVAGLSVYRETTVPSSGSEDFARIVDVFTNSTGSPIDTTVKIVGNLGSDAGTIVFNTSDGDTVVETTDQWIGTDDADASGTPPLIHYLHGPAGLRPSSVQVNGDNIEWTYTLTVAAGQTVRLAHFTILNHTRAGAMTATNTLITASGFGGQAAAFLTADELATLANFQLNRPPTFTSPATFSLLENTRPRLNIVAEDPDFDLLVIRGNGGSDQGLFTITADGGLTFNAAPDYENPTDANRDNVYEVTVEVDDGQGHRVTQDLRVRVVPLLSVQSVRINDGAAQRSRVTSVTVTFSSQVTRVDGSPLDAGAFTLQRRENGLAILLTASVAVVDGKTVATLTFSGGGTEYGSLADGNYLLTIHTDRIKDQNGNGLDGDGDGQVGGDRTFGTAALDKFFRLYGDSDGDRDVDNLDFYRFRSSYGKRMGNVGFLAYFDYDADGDVDAGDYAAFSTRRGRRI